MDSPALREEKGRVLALQAHVARLGRGGALLQALYGLLLELEDVAHSPNIHRKPLATTTAKKAQAAPMPMAIGMAFTLPS
jgi:hypothetical protein